MYLFKLILASGSVGQSPSAIQTSGGRPTKYHQKMKSEGEDGDGWGAPFANQHQGSQDRPSAGIPRVREREDDQGTLGVVTTRLTLERPATHGAN